MANHHRLPVPIMEDNAVNQILALRLHNQMGDRELCLEAGMDDYIAKPVRVDELVSALKRSSEIKGE